MKDMTYMIGGRERRDMMGCRAITKETRSEGEEDPKKTEKKEIEGGGKEEKVEGYSRRGLFPGS